MNINHIVTFASTQSVVVDPLRLLLIPLLAFRNIRAQVSAHLDEAHVFQELCVLALGVLMSKAIRFHVLGPWDPVDFAPA